MASISSLSSINGLNLWLDATDIRTMVFDPLFLPQFSTITPALMQWNDKSSNAYQFNPLRSNDRPKISTYGTSSVAVLFDQVSSFQLISKSKIPANSTLNFFAVVTPYSLYGPFQPFFDSADITVSETDGRFNTQIYSDGNEMLRGVSLQNTVQGATIFQGDLYLGTNVNQTPNYLQRYNRLMRAFEYFPPPLCNISIRALGVYRGAMFAAANNTWEYYMPASTTTKFISTNFMSTTTGPLVVYNRQLYSAPQYGWDNLYNQNAATIYPPGYSNVLLRWTPTINTFSTVLTLSSNIVSANNNTNFTTFNCNYFIYRGDMYMTMYNYAYGYQLFRYNENTVTFNRTNLAANVIGYTGVYYGSLILPFNNQKLYRWNENISQWFARLQFPVTTNYSGPQGGFCAYKGQLFIMRNGYFGVSPGGVNCNTIETIPGLFGGSFNNTTSLQITTNFNVPNGANSSNLLIVHDGKLFYQANQNNIIYEYGNGTSLDRSFSTFVNAPILLQIQKTPKMSQMFLNGTLVQTEYTDFTFSNQPAREMFIGGSAGTMASGISDVGSDHLQGAIHTIAQYNQVLSTEERQKVEGILAWTYGIQNVLPASHPYRTSMP
jgi:hypothetical protein